MSLEENLLKRKKTPLANEKGFHVSQLYPNPFRYPLTLSDFLAMIPSNNLKSQACIFVLVLCSSTSSQEKLKQLFHLIAL